VTRTPGDGGGVHHHEMRRNRPTDELDQALAGDGPLAEVLVDLAARAQATEPPAPGEELAAVFAGGRSARPGAVAAPAARPATRRRRLVTLAGIGVAVLAGTGVAGALPEPAQRPFDRVADAVGFDRHRPAPVAEVPEVAPVVDDEGVGPAPVPAPRAEPPTVVVEHWRPVPWPPTTPPAIAADEAEAAPTDPAAPPMGDPGRRGPTPADPAADVPAQPAPGASHGAPSDDPGPSPAPPAAPSAGDGSGQGGGDTVPPTTRTPSEADRRSP
jgi:hypothetical protein